MLPLILNMITRIDVQLVLLLRLDECGQSPALLVCGLMMQTSPSRSIDEGPDQDCSQSHSSSGPN